VAVEFCCLPGHAHREIGGGHPGPGSDAGWIFAKCHGGWRNRWSATIDHRFTISRERSMVETPSEIENKMPCFYRAFYFLSRKPANYVQSKFTGVVMEAPSICGNTRSGPGIANFSAV
jgi:hypothetical protein